MRTDRVRARLSAYLEGDVSSREATRIETALEASPELREELRALQATVSLLRGLPRPQAPPALTERVVARVRAGEADPVRWRDWLHRIYEPAFVVPLAVSAAALLVVVGTPTGGLLEDGPAPGASLAGAGYEVIAARETAHPETSGVRNPNRVALRIQQQQQQRLRLMRILRGAGHPHSASLASQMDGDVVLASLSDRR